MQFEEMNVQGSRLFLYYNERKLDKDIPEDAGSTISEAVIALKKYGLCKESEWPYDEKTLLFVPQKIVTPMHCQTN